MILSILKIIIGIPIFVILLYIEYIYPYTKQAIIKQITNEYQQLKNGRIGYPYFVNYCSTHYLQPNENDPADTVTFKLSMIKILNDMEYVDYLMSGDDSVISFEKRLKTYGLNQHADSGIEISHLPIVFQTAKAQEIIMNMKRAGYCREDLTWDTTHSTYLMALFADAIGKKLKISNKCKWKYFKMIWGNYNFSNLYSDACGSPNKDKLLKEVQAIFPDYEISNGS